MATHTRTILAISIVFLFASKTLLFAEVDGETSFGLIWALIGIMFPSLLLICFGIGVYLWLKRRKISRLKIQRQIDDEENLDITMLHEPFSYNRTIASIYPDCGRNTQEKQLEDLERSALEDLERIFRLDDNELRQSYVLIANLVKNYVSEKYGIKIKHLTTAQILESLPNGPTDLVADHAGEILRGCDMIEFSHYRPLRTDLKDIYVSTKEFLENQLEDNKDAEI